MGGNAAYAVHIVPAAFTFSLGTGANFGGEFAAFLQIDFGHEHGEAQFAAECFQVAVLRFGRGEDDFGLQGRADGFVGTQRLDGGVYNGAGFADVRPFFRERGFAGGGDGWEVVQGVMMSHASSAVKQRMGDIRSTRLRVMW